MKNRWRKEWYRFRHCGMADVSETNDLAFLDAEIYRSEMEKIMKWIAASPDIETGGELFGFWKDDGTPVIAYAIGPGPKANHQIAFFNQDLDYLMAAGRTLTGVYGLEHIGEWHSHHRLGLAHPSGHDAATVVHGMAKHGRNRFLLCIGTINGRQASLGAFSFLRGEKSCNKHVGWRVINIGSPYRTAIGDL